MHSLLIASWTGVPVHLSSDLLAQGAGVLVLLAASILVYRTFRERYLVIWVLGWLLYLVYRQAQSTAYAFAGSKIAWVISQTCFILALTCFTAAVLFYTNSRKYLFWIGILSALAVDAVIVRTLWFGFSGGFALLIAVLCHAMAAVAVVRLAMFARGRRDVGLWILTMSLALLHPDQNPLASHAIPALDTCLEIALGVSMVMVVLEDSRVRARRVEVVNVITTAVAEARDYRGVMLTALSELRKLTDARSAWFRMLEGDRLVIQQQIGLPEFYLEKRRSIGLASAPVGELTQDRVTAKLRVAALGGEERELLQRFGIEHVILLPVMGKSALIGLLTIAVPTVRSYTPDELRFLTTTANQLGIAVENLRMFEQILRSQRQWLSTFDSIDDYIVVHDADHRILRLNRALARRLGRSQMEIVGRFMADTFPNLETGCPYCLRAMQHNSEAPDPCFGGYSLVSTSSYTEELGVEIGTVHIIRDTTEQRAAEERYRLLFEEVQEGVFVSTPDGHMVDCNAAFIRMLGYESRQEVMNLDIAGDVFAEPAQRIAYKETMELYGHVHDYEVRVRRKDGKVRTLLENGFASRDARGRIERYQGFLVDITEKKRVEEDIRRRNRELGALNSIATTATQTFDLDVILNSSLQQTSELFSSQQCDILLIDPETGEVRRSVSSGQAAVQEREFMANRMRQHLREPIERLRPEVITEYTLAELSPELHEWVMAEGYRSLAWIISYSQRKPLCVLAISSKEENHFTETDLSLANAIGRQLGTMIEKVLLYEETVRAYDDLRQTQEQLLQSEKMSAIGQLISGVAHELNNPLTAILGYAQLLESEPLSERANDFVGKLYKQTQRTHRVVQNLLSFARQRKPIKTQVDLRRVLEDTLALRDYDLKLNNIQVERIFDPAVPFITGDAHQLEQVFLNVINNAVDAILDCSKSGTLRVRIYLEQDRACIEFHDSGSGLKDPKRIFDPFYTTKKVGKGTGLGLSICYGIMKEHGGDIIAFNHPEGGAVFQLKLPVTYAGQTRVEQSAPAAEERRLNVRVLLVEDEEAILEFEREVLEDTGATVTCASAGDAALKLLQENEFDVLIIDAKMPGSVSAIDIHHWIRQNRPELSRRMVLTLSHSAEPELRELMRQERVPAITKPFEVAELVALVRRVCSLSAKASSV